nr:MAG TPA: hypothetical protein [Caudoviricetes sp.]
MSVYKSAQFRTHSTPSSVPPPARSARCGLPCIWHGLPCCL